MIRVFSFCLLMPLAACFSKKDKVEGTFVRQINHEYALGSDTIFIRPINETTYHIEKRASFQRTTKSKGKMSPVEFQNRNWKGVYDNVHNLIREDMQGRVLVLSEDKELIIMGNLEYTRAE